ncbi:MAG TPA: hypothetical protein VH083_16810 [Myxococcales bacterium]|jgi:hypothetical protein|nr:hypothetical protein [Myxococcales bacterium]
MRFPLVATLALSLIACASSNTSAAKKKSADPKETLASNAGGPAAKGKYVCTYDEDTGSHMRTKTCRYVDEDNASGNRHQAQDDMREMGMHNTATTK